MTADPGARLWSALALAFLVSGCATIRPVDPALSSRLGELLLVGFAGTAVEGNTEVHHLICDLKVGGVILFEQDTATGAPRNITSPEQLARLTRDLQALARLCAGRPLLIAADSEGGAVIRLSPRSGYSPTFSAREMGELGDLVVTELEALRIGAMLRQAGINWNLAPVVDLALNPLNPVIVARDRAFSAYPEQVVTHARAYLHGMRDGGLLTTLKHFPGHGSSWEDSHLGFVDVTETASLELELGPYRELMREGLVDSVMTAHVFNRKLDADYLATLSQRIISGLLRGELGFDGVVVSDDLLMGAILKHYGLEEASLLALQAGVDMLLISHTRLSGGSAPERVLGAIRTALGYGTLSADTVKQALARIDRLRSRAN
ncbi:MAG: glycoside hydrolase family 3 protein [Candidatus Methylomirabilia bacterium]